MPARPPLAAVSAPSPESRKTRRRLVCCIITPLRPDYCLGSFCQIRSTYVIIPPYPEFLFGFFTPDQIIATQVTHLACAYRTATVYSAASGNLNAGGCSCSSSRGRGG